MQENTNIMTKVAVIEDDLALQKMYVYKLEHEGFTVQATSNGQLGLVLAENFQPDVILLDLRMPVLSGDKMLEQLRQTDWGSNIRVVVLTNISKSEAPSTLRFLSVDRYIVKAHTTPAEVVDIIREVIGSN